MDLQRNSIIGEYRIVDFLGEGGMGQVYRAVHTRIDRTVAIKVLTQTLGESISYSGFSTKPAYRPACAIPASLLSTTLRKTTAEA